jgi:hypothetical protein
MHQGLNFGVRNALKLTYEHVTVRKNFPGATPPGPPGGGRGGEGRGMGEGKAEGGGGRGMGEYGEGRAGVRIQTFEFRPPSISSLKVGLQSLLPSFVYIFSSSLPSSRPLTQTQTQLNSSPLQPPGDQQYGVSGNAPKKIFDQISPGDPTLRPGGPAPRGECLNETLH